jgi:hypothetical protein
LRFGAYFNPPKFEDHWVCEYWDAERRGWALADAQLDAVWYEKIRPNSRRATFRASSS